MLKTSLKIVLSIVLIAVSVVIGLRLRDRLVAQDNSPQADAARLPAPVDIAEITRGTLVLRRTISGTLVASAEFTVAPKVSGRVVRLLVDLADTVTNRQVVAILDDAEYVQAVAQADADLAVATAQLAEATGALSIAERTLARVTSLREKDMAAEFEFDNARSDQVSALAQVEVAKARVTRAESSVAAARIRLAYTQVVADWGEGDDLRVVGERFVDAGDTVSANAPLFHVVELNPIQGVLFVPERDYARLRPGQAVKLQTDAYPGKEFHGTIERIAPVFRETTRQARVELRFENKDQGLRPGMFMRATVELDRVDDAIIVPFSALTARDGSTGLFVTDAAKRRVQWRPVEVGIAEDERVQVIAKDGEALSGHVVTLGQHLVDDGGAISPSFEPAPPQRDATLPGRAEPADLE